MFMEFINIPIVKATTTIPTRCKKPVHKLKPSLACLLVSNSYNSINICQNNLRFSALFNNLQIKV